MASNTVVILSGHSLFAEGTASSLRRSTDALQITVINSREPNLLEQITEIAPGTVILDTSDDTLIENCPITALLEAIPDLRIIRLDPESEEIQVVTGEQRKAANINELIELIGTVGTDPQEK
ncbi:MAG: hypothetical protein GTO18_19705 [Anaerolineales bacterium]|nr:hypothetical protein [Anaerolineales bacterium]